MVNKKVMVIMAHPDDAELLCFGGIKFFSEIGYKVEILVIANKHTKANGNIDLEIDLKRQNETIKAFSSLKDIKVSFGGFEDGNLVQDSRVISFIESKIKVFRPDIVITHFVDTFGYDHQDHTVVAKSVLNCTYRAQVKSVLHAQPHCVKTSFIPNYYIDITDYFSEKMKALSKHLTQRDKHYFNQEYQNLKHTYNMLFHTRNIQSEPKKFETYFCSHYLENK